MHILNIPIPPHMLVITNKLGISHTEYVKVLKPYLDYCLSYAVAIRRDTPLPNIMEYDIHSDMYNIPISEMTDICEKYSTFVIEQLELHMLSNPYVLNVHRGFFLITNYEVY